MGHHRDQLVHLLQERPSDPGLQRLINQVEQEDPADLTSSASLLRGVWELRWSSSKQPWLKQTAGLENLQALDPEQGRGCNLLRSRQVGMVEIDLEVAEGARDVVAVGRRRLTLVADP